MNEPNERSEKRTVTLPPYQNRFLKSHGFSPSRLLQLKISEIMKKFEDRGNDGGRDSDSV